MKKTAVCFVLAVGIMASLSSCLTTHKMVVDTNVPEDQTATVTFVNDPRNGYFIVKEWNNIKIVDELYGNKSISSDDKTKLTVPAGNTSLTFDVEFAIGGGNSYATYTLKNIELRYDMEQGKLYKIKGLIKAKSLSLFKSNVYEAFVSIYDVTDIKNIELLKEWKLGEAEW